jgi:chitinase
MCKNNISIFLVLVVLMGSCSQKAVVAQSEPVQKSRVLAYLFSDNNWQAAISGVALSKLTDLNLAFFNPDANGQIAENAQLSAVIAAAHQSKLRVYLSFGGGGGPAFLKELIAGEKGTKLAHTIADFAAANGFDGVDVDLENDLITDQYGAFVAKLSAALKAKKLLMTAALASWNANIISNATLGLYDYINIMSYDKTGPWDLSMPGQHSPFEMAEADFNYFSVSRGIPANKLLIGLPFYGYGFGGAAPASNTYKEIVQAYAGAENKDLVELADGGKIYYNGIPTIKQKCAFAKSHQAAGVMIWEIQQDSKDDKSLLDAISTMLQ